MTSLTGRCFAAIVAGLSCAGIATGQTYTATVDFYKVHDAPVEILSPDEVDARLNAAVEGCLDSPITVSFEHTSLKEIFRLIEQIYPIQFHLDLSAAPDGLASEPRVDYINLKGVSVREALEAILVPLKLNYYVDGSIIQVRQTAPSPGLSTRAIDWYRPSKSLTVVPDGAVRIGSSVVRLSPGSHGKIENNPNVTRVAAPRITLNANQQSEVAMTSVVEWFAPIPGNEGDFRLQHSASPAGTRVSLLVKETSNGQAECSMTLSADTLRERRPAPGTTLEVGEPVFDNATGSAVVTVTPGQPVALLTGLGAAEGDTLLAVLRIDPGPPTEQAVRAGDYALDSRLIKVRGEPDWKFWMQPYARAARIYAGAGQALGPVEIARVEKRSKSFDWARLGFSHVKESEPTDTGNGGLIDIFDSQFGVLDRASATLYHFSGAPQSIDPAHPIFSAYRQVAPDGPPLKPEDIQGKAQTLSMTTRIGEDGQPATQCDWLAYGAATREEGGAYRIDWRVLINSPHIDARQEFVRRELRFNCETAGDALFAYLLPIARDEFWIVLTKFKVME